jgi:hypothetical protein
MISIEQRVENLIEHAVIAAEIEIMVETDIAEREGFVGVFAHELALMRLQGREQVAAEKVIRVMSLRQVV